MADRFGRGNLLLVGIIFHLVYLWSIFDIYFVSPLVHGMNQHVSTTSPPAKRLVLVVGDGLRADKCFARLPDPDDASGTQVDYLAPFIRSRVLEHGTFGISHTRMPTESRPGHVALIAGFYEDVSAVTKGWKENPVDFDSVFNQSRHTWSFGSPDILPMFSSGASDPNRVETFMYGHDFEDFTKDTLALDTFVFDHVENLFASAKTNSTLDALLRQDKIVFFLHLLGIDTAGHAFRPYSKEYYRNIKHVDRGVAKVQELFDKFYHNDMKTTYVFTADHGMSDFGSHGDGHPDNTRTPLVAWGAGISKPKLGKSGHDDYSRPWDLPVKRHDVAQADIASLMSFLVGINYPANSVGELPTEFLSVNEEQKSEAIYANTLEIVEQYRVKENLTQDLQFVYHPFSKLHNSTFELDDALIHVKELIHDGHYSEAIKLCETIMQLSLSGLRYLQTYNWLFLRSIVTLGFLGWIIYACGSMFSSFILDPGAVPPPQNSYFLTVVAMGILSAVWGIMYHQEAPLMHYLYAIFPIFFWESVIERRKSIVEGAKALIARTHSHHSTGFYICSLVGSIFILECIVAGYFYRQVFSALFVFATLWPIFQSVEFCKSNKPVVGLWVLCCLGMSVFTLLPVVKIESQTQILVGGILMVSIGAFFIHDSWRKNSDISGFTLTLLGAQLGLVVLSQIVTYSSVESLQNRQGLPLGNQVVGWCVLVGSIALPFLHRMRPVQDYQMRLLVLFLSVSPTFVILTISYEGLFFVTFFSTITVWMEIETSMYKINDATRSTKDIRRISVYEVRTALFFFFLAQVAFFGTGNIASISSFSLDSVYRLLPIFDPFAMGALLLFKILVPFALLTAQLAILNLRIGVPASALFAMVMSVSDVLTLNFFYLVRDEGSWLDIGTSISHFCIASMLCIFMTVLEYLGDILIEGVAIDDDEAKTKLHTS